MIGYDAPSDHSHVLAHSHLTALLYAHTNIYLRLLFSAPCDSLKAVSGEHRVEFAFVPHGAASGRTRLP